jgi:hypothetical protein
MTVLTLRALKRLLREAGFEGVQPHRRGRGSRYILHTSAALAREYGDQARPLSPMLVDLLATFIPSLSEECVVSASKGPAR